MKLQITAIFAGALLAALGVLLVSIPAYASGTATVSGHIFLDDDCNNMIDKSTDSNGVLDAGETCVGRGVKVYFVDSSGIHFTMTDVFGNFTTTVPTDIDVTVYIAQWDLALPTLYYAPTTQTTYTYTLTPGSTTVVPDFAYGPTH